MRVIAGKARSLPLKTIDGPETRPTTDRIKETLFNMLQMDVPGCRFLDLYAGSGAIGIEALSRGARQSVFVEHNPKAAQCIRENLEFTKLADRAVVMNTEVLTALQRLKGKNDVFDIVFMDPPYQDGVEPEVLRLLKDAGIADAGTLVVIEASLDNRFLWLEESGYHMVRAKKYKTNQHVFIRMTE